MGTLTATDIKNGFGRLIDLAWAESVVIAKRGRPVVVIVAVEEYERRRGRNTPKLCPSRKPSANK